MSQIRHAGRRALVTGGAGLIGSHVVDLLLREGWAVRVLDNLEPLTHRRGQPDWVPSQVEFIQADICDRAALSSALQDIDVVFHQAAYGGFMPEIAKFVAVNSLGTALLLETIRDALLPVRKVIVASSQVVYREGAAACPLHGRFFPQKRPLAQLQTGSFEVRCPQCGAACSPLPTPEHAPTAGDTTYAITKFDQERLALSWSQQTGIPVVALRYACTYGPRQSIFNPYTGVITIFCTRLLNQQPPVLYEDGRQSRDFCFVEDIARANLLAASSDALDGLAVNVGSGQASSVRQVAELLAAALGVAIEPVVTQQFRPGELRHLIPDLSLIQAAGFRAEVDLAAGIERYLAWIRRQADVRDYFAEAHAVLQTRRLVHAVAVPAPIPGVDG